MLSKAEHGKGRSQSEEVEVGRMDQSEGEEAEGGIMGQSEKEGRRQQAKRKAAVMHTEREETERKGGTGGEGGRKRRERLGTEGGEKRRGQMKQENLAESYNQNFSTSGSPPC